MRFNMRKKCTKCGKRKTVSNFHTDKRYKLGVFSWCKQCEKDYQNERYDKNKERGRADAKKWRSENPEAVKAIKKKAYNKRKKETGLTGYQSKEAKAERMAIYRDKNRESLRRKSRERYHKMVQTHEGVLYWRALVHRRLDRGSYVTAKMIQQIEAANIEKYGILTCEYCKVPVGETYHLEHKNPISRGGKSTEVNLCIACPPCNLHKGTLTAEEFRERLKVI